MPSNSGYTVNRGPVDRSSAVHLFYDYMPIDFIFVQNEIVMNFLLFIVSYLYLVEYSCP